MSTLGWGFDPYGISPFGHASLGGALAGAVAISTHEVLVTLTFEPMNESTTKVGDVSNPATWMVQRLDTLEMLNVIQVNKYGDLEYGIVTYQALGPASVTHRVSTLTLLDSSGALCSPPRQADFAGVIADVDQSPQTKLAQRRVYATDIDNRQTPNVSPDVAGGVLQIGSSGDYELVTGVELVKKLLFRRIMTSPGEFFHLPDYGLGLQLKEPVPVSSLSQKKAELERQALREPEVIEARATITVSSNNVINIQLRVKLQTGETAVVSLPVPSAGVML
jgi:hypothetical protein